MKSSILLAKGISGFTVSFLTLFAMIVLTNIQISGVDVLSRRVSDSQLDAIYSVVAMFSFMLSVFFAVLFFVSLVDCIKEAINSNN